MAYIMNEGHGEYGRPSRFYFETIRDGYDDFGFEYKYLLHALQASRMSIK